ncbi:MAG: putative lipid II flippase FtsW [Oscillospiraceae bacterium]|jgi:cell division protein FtsW|nr:putative lipid II flippase FtsW [Oscillospiraceae bacterium]
MSDATRRNGTASPSRQKRPPLRRPPTRRVPVTGSARFNDANARFGVPAALPSAAVLRKTRVKPRKPGVSSAPPKVRERFAKFDIPFFTITAVLLAFGIVILLSSSHAFAFREHGDSYFFFKRQLMCIALGLAAMIGLSLVDYHILRNKKIVTVAAAGSIGLMLMVRLTGAGVSQGGAERWLRLFGITFQPSEILKFAVIVVLAYVTHKNAGVIKSFFKGFVPFAAFLGIACGLTMIQPHISGTIIIFLIGLTMMTVGGCKISHILFMCACLGVMAFIGFEILKARGYTYFDDRILSWRNPEADITGSTYQTYQSLVTIGSGGWLGLGLGNSRGKLGYLPAAHNDFIFSVMCEEIGFVGALLVILLFVIFVFRGFYIASRARDLFGTMIAAGITAQIGIQALLNIAVATNSVPNTGILLPFFSYGGTALIMQMAQLGILLNISRKAAVK